MPRADLPGAEWTPADLPGAGWFGGLFFPYPVRVKLGASNKLLATINSAGIRLLRSILLMTTSLLHLDITVGPLPLWLLDPVCALSLADDLEFRQKSKSVCVR